MKYLPCIPSSSILECWYDILSTSRKTFLLQQSLKWFLGLGKGKAVPVITRFFSTLHHFVSAETPNRLHYIRALHRRIQNLAKNLRGEAFLKNVKDFQILNVCLVFWIRLFIRSVLKVFRRTFLIKAVRRCSTIKCS